MIKLSHIKACASVIDSSHVNDLLSLPFFTDTRKYRHPGAFVAIPGAKVNPLDVIDSLLKQECPVVIYQANEENKAKVEGLMSKYPGTHFIAVTDSVTFLQELTHFHIKSWKEMSSKNTVFAISGSNGKTTHKEMLSHIMHNLLPEKVVATEKNNNNHLGVPLTLLNVTPETEFVVLELGSNHPGEIKILCDIASPNAGLTTNIGATHLEFFGSEEKVFEEEGYLYHAVKDNTQGKGFFLINADDTFLAKLPDTDGSVRFGESSSSQAKVSFQEQGASIRFNDKDISVSNEYITGKHNKLNLVTCAFIASHFYPEHKDAIRKAASTFRPTKNRSQWMEFEGRSIFLDAYNANPSSMKAALSGFKESVIEKGLSLDQSCIVLGDMNELGEKSPQYHAELGKFIGELGFPHVYFVGRYSDDYQKGFPRGSKVASSEAFKSEYRNECLKKFSIHFIKGSRSLQLESLFDIT